jgi:hypothetical protein
VELADPHRIVTFFVYMNTMPKGNGHTIFPLLPGKGGACLSVQPKEGMALIFGNVLSDNEADPRTCHQVRKRSPGCDHTVGQSVKNFDTDASPDLCLDGQGNLWR